MVGVGGGNGGTGVRRGGVGGGGRAPGVVVVVHCKYDPQNNLQSHYIKH